jgi:hypothetical protein
LDSYHTTVEVHDGEIHSGERLKQGNLLLNVKISAFTSVNLIWSNLDDGDDVSWLNIWDTVSLTRDGVLLALRASLIDLNGEFFPVSGDFLALADLASLLHVDHLSLTVTLVTRLGALRVHAGAHLSEDCPHTLSLTGCASLDSGGVSSSDTIACTADSLSIHLDLNGLAVVDVSQANIDLFCLWLDSGLSLGTCTTTAATHEHAKDVVHALTSASSSLKALHSVLVVGVPLILVEKDLVGSLNFFELED